jgi:hypothetical protein
LSECCRKDEAVHQLRPTLFCLRHKHFFESGTADFDRKNSSPQSQDLLTIGALGEKLQRKNDDIVELIGEHVQPRKELGEL